MKNGRGETCHYCKRRLEHPTSRSRVAATKDHVYPKSLGGRVKVWCCRQCNNMKADKTPEQWQAFMDATPRWWRLQEYFHYGVKRKTYRLAPTSGPLGPVEDRRP